MVGGFLKHWYLRFASATRGGVSNFNYFQTNFIKTHKKDLFFESACILAQAALRAPQEVALQCVAGHCYYQLSLSLSSLFSSTPSSAFDPLPGISVPCVKICFPQYFGITRRYMQKKIFFLGNFYSFTKKS